MRQAAPIALAGLGVVVAGVVAALPQPRIDLLVWRLWLPHIIPAAAPPVGVTGRVALAIGALLPFLGAALLVHLIGNGRVRFPARRSTAPATAIKTVSVRRADAHPDAPPRRPIRASEDLGPPLPIAAPPPSGRVPEPERPLPADLDLPLAAFDPIAMPDAPLAPTPTVAPLVVLPPVTAMSASSAHGFGEWESGSEEPGVAKSMPYELPVAAPAWEGAEARAGSQKPVKETAAAAAWLIELVEPETDRTMAAPAVDLVDAAPSAGSRDMGVEQDPAPPVEHANDTLSFLTAVPKPVGETSIASLLDRLERGAKRRAAPTPPPAPVPAPAASLDDTLGMLRRLATN
ncbi:hypothetical protein [Sphingomonas sp. TZW2008]|uniref:hypothetical protein n=1 Tax=Sphingomonas sp. TZW2008 TaxID=1917973 RepID=UPI0015C51B41|nr:hypothetical protein [Sphingomonas sp. TZW2008]